VKSSLTEEYQRSDKVWPGSAQSYLIETIVLGFPMPKLSLYQRTDLQSKKTFKEIVDGQQRSMAIRQFFDNKAAASRRRSRQRRSRVRLIPSWSRRSSRSLLTYQLNVDLFVLLLLKKYAKCSGG